MKDLLDKAVMQNHPLRILETFVEKEKKNEAAGNYDDMNFVGYALRIGYDTVTIITADRFKLIVGGVPRNSLLIMVPENLEGLLPHFTLLRVAESAPTPLDKHQQETYFELHKKSMPELDIFTQSELQWGALETNVLGMFYPNPDKADTIEFSSDMNNFVSAHKYRVYSPSDELLNLIVNSLVPQDHRFPIGNLRLTECRLPLPDKPLPNITANISADDFMGTRTAMFGKTRFGKSNIIKLIAQSILETTQSTNHVGQLIFDIDGEYANDNQQDDSSSIRSAYPDRCTVYALTPKPNTPSKQLRLNFYEHPEASLRVLGDLIEKDKKTGTYIRNFAEAEILPIESLAEMEINDKLRATRRILLYWAILNKAGYDVNEGELSQRLEKGFNPNYNKALREAVYGAAHPPATPPAKITTLAQLQREFDLIAAFLRITDPGAQILMSSSGSGQAIFGPDERALLEFLNPPPGRSGTRIIQRFRAYHHRSAGDFIKEILDLLDKGQTVIIDLSNANLEVRRYFSNELSDAIYAHQVDKFTSNQPKRPDGLDHYIQLYFEEAHHLFPAKEEKDDVYAKIAKEGAKCNIGMVYSTQSVTSVHHDLLNQTENFFIAHLSSQIEVQMLAKVSHPYEKLQDDILQSRTPGYVRMLTRSHRFVVPVQARRFTAPAKGVTVKKGGKNQ